MIAAEDPGAFTERHASATLGAQDEQVLEYICENNQLPLHISKP